MLIFPILQNNFTINKEYCFIFTIFIPIANYHEDFVYDDIVVRK